jgi:hypothetical protein
VHGSASHSVAVRPIGGPLGAGGEAGAQARMQAAAGERSRFAVLEHYRDELWRLG